MDNIPGDWLHDALRALRDLAAGPAEFLYHVANHHADRAESLRGKRIRGWQSASRELDGVADHIRQYADALEQHAALYPPPADGVTVDWDTVRLDIAKPAPNPADGTLPGNTGRCASFRRATPGDETVCTLERGHTGDHGALVLVGPGAWPRQHSGHVCGDVVILHDGTALNCQLPLGHDGDEHYDGRFRLWPRGAGTSRQTRICEQCNMDTHACPGCGEPLGHFVTACEPCTRGSDEAAEHGVGVPLPAETHADREWDSHEASLATEPGTVPPCADLQPDVATAAGTSCMLPKGHTGKHIGYTGARWEQAAVTLAEQTDAARAALTPSIPEQRTAEGDQLTPAAVMVVEMKAEVTAAVGELTEGNPFLTAGGLVPEDASLIGNPFAAPTTLHAHPAPAATLSNPFMPPAPPPAPKAELLPPHLVPGAPKAYQSVSSIQAMGECGLRYRLKYRDGLAEFFTAWWNVGGGAFHKTIEHIERSHAESAGALYSITEPVFQTEGAAVEVWRETFAAQILATEQSTGTKSSTWRAAKGGKENRAWWEVSGEEMVRRYVHHRVEFLKGWRLLTTPGGGFAQEVKFNAPIHGVVMKGFIDSAWISADGATIRVEDYKSGSSAGDPFQLKTYGAALRAMGADIGTDGAPRRIVGTFYEARKGASAPLLELTTADDTEVSYRANTTAMMDQAGIFPANPSPSNCSTCPVSNSCPVMAMKS